MDGTLHYSRSPMQRASGLGLIYMGVQGCKISSPEGMHRQVLSRSVLIVMHMAVI